MGDKLTAIQRNLIGFDDYYDKPSWWFRLRYGTQYIRKTCLHLLRLSGRSLSRQRVLEIGFGSAATLLSFNRNCMLVGIEASKSAVRFAKRSSERRGFNNCEFRLVRDSQIPYDSEFFDIVIASHLLEHVENDLDCLAEISRVLRPDGVVIILIPINERHDDPYHVRKYSTELFKRTAEGAGFGIKHSLENEFLSYLVEKFYHANYNTRWGLLGSLIVGAFHIPTSILPFRAYQVIDCLYQGLGFKPKQAGFVLSKKTSDK